MSSSTYAAYLNPETSWYRASRVCRFYTVSRKPFPMKSAGRLFTKHQ